MTSRRAMLALCAATMGVACELLTVPQGSGVPAIVLTAPPWLADVLDEVNHVQVRISPPEMPARDTTFVRDFGAAQIRARVTLRPGEGVPGTALDVELKRDHVFLFRGLVVLDRETLLEGSIHLPIHPVARLAVADDTIAIVGDTMALDAAAWIVLDDGRVRSPEDVRWRSNDLTVITITGERAVAVGVGDTELLAVWSEQIDSFRVSVHPTGVIFMSDTVRNYYLAADDTITDTLTITQSQVGDVGELSATGDPPVSWLTFGLEADTTPSVLEIRIDGSELPENTPPGRVKVTSEYEGVEPVVVEIDARRDPTTDIETMSWAPFCAIGERVDPKYAGIYGCIDLRAKSWIEGDVKRVVLEAESLQGSVGDSLDTAIPLKVTGFGVIVPAMAGRIELFSFRSIEPVGVVGSPHFEIENDGGFSLQGKPPRGSATIVDPIIISALSGCAVGNTRNGFLTCDPEGLTGKLRADFQVTDTAWALATASVYMDFSLMGVIALNACADDPDGICWVVR